MSLTWIQTKRAEWKAQGLTARGTVRKSVVCRVINSNGLKLRVPFRRVKAFQGNLNGLVGKERRRVRLHLLWQQNYALGLTARGTVPKLRRYPRRTTL